jgi:hypothetical protein
MVATPTVWGARHLAGPGVATVARLAGTIGDLCRNSHRKLTEPIRDYVSRSHGLTSGRGQAPRSARGGSAIHRNGFIGNSDGLRMTQTLAP